MRNVPSEGHPAGPWATAAQSPKGVYGVAFGHGQLQIGFVTEAQLNAFITAARKVEEGDEYLNLVIAAAKALPGLKATIRLREKAASN